MEKENMDNLDHRFAYIYKNGGTPIRTFAQVPVAKMKLLATSAPDPEWQERIDAEWWGKKGLSKGLAAKLANGKAIDSRFIELNRLLLSFGGHETCFPAVEEDMAKILERGQLWIGDHSILIKGEPSRCHANSSNLWLANKDKNEVAIATGYALSKDGLWRQHTWLVQRNARSVRVIETTVKRVCYFGFVMTDAEAEKFADTNF